MDCSRLVTVVVAVPSSSLIQIMVKLFIEQLYYYRCNYMLMNVPRMSCAPFESFRASFESLYRKHLFEFESMYFRSKPDKILVLEINI